MAKKTVGRVKFKDDSESKLFAVLGVFLLIIGYIVVMLTRKNDKYAMFYAKQGLVLFIAAVIASVAAWAVGWIPFIGRVVSGALWIIIVVLWIIGIIYVLSGDEKEIPIIGEFAKKI